MSAGISPSPGPREAGVLGQDADVVSLVRQFVVNWINRADPNATREILSPDYALTIGTAAFVGREAYTRATHEQLLRFPGLTLTVHDLLANESACAIRFTEHGRSSGPGSRSAAWGGIALFWSDGRVLIRSACQEDYAGRARQLRSGAPDRVQPPMSAPWLRQTRTASPSAEATVTAWLHSANLAEDEHILLDGEPVHSPARHLISHDQVEVLDMISAGEHVAFHIEQRGRLLGAGHPARGTSEPMRLRATGIVQVSDTGHISGHVMRDRAGLAAVARERGLSLDLSSPGKRQGRSS